MAHVFCFAISANLELTDWQYHSVPIMVLKNSLNSLKHCWLHRLLFSLHCHHFKLKNPNLFKLSSNRSYFVLLATFHLSTFSIYTNWTYGWPETYLLYKMWMHDLSIKDIHLILVFYHRNYDHHPLTCLLYIKV